jgi:imidazoleglycerol-phosphate dehydratase
MNVSVERTTHETSITIDLGFPESLSGSPTISTGVPFFDHMLHACTFHGGMDCTIRAEGDIDVDPHHLVEDVGIVLGDAVRGYVEKNGPIQRFGHAIIPMDEALSEVIIDVCGRPYLVYRADLPQSTVGTFDVSLVREFLHGFASHGMMNLHADCRYGENSHHMIEALFKALGKALRTACRRVDGAPRSTKGTL